MTNINPIKLVTKLAGIFIALNGVCVMLGWITHTAFLIQFSSTLPPMQFNTALCFLLCGIALYNLYNPNTLFLKIIGSALLIITILVGNQYIFNVNVGIDTFFIKPFISNNTIHPGRISPNSTLDLFFVGITFILLSWKKAYLHFWYNILIVLLSSLIVAFSLVTFIEFITSLATEKISVGFTLMSLHAAICFFVLGVVLIIYVFNIAKNLISLFPIPIFFGLLTSVFYISHAIKNYENTLFIDTVHNEVVRAANEFNQSQTNLYRALNHIKERWTTQNGTPQAWFAADARTYLHDYATLRGLSIIDKNFKIKWTMPEKYQYLIGRNYNIDPERSKTIQEAMATRTAQTTRAVRLLADNSAGFVFIDPLYVKNNFDGFLVAGFNADASFNYLFQKNILMKYYLIVTEENSLVYSSLPADPKISKEWSQSAKTTLNNRVWEFTLIPKPIYIANKNSNIPLIVLIAGFFISLITSLAIFFGLKAKENEHALSEAQAQLKWNKDWLQSILDASHHSIISVDRNGTIQLFNHAAERMLGYKAKEVVNKLSPEIIHIDKEVADYAAELTKLLGYEVEPGFETFVSRLTVQDADEREWTYVRKDGSTFPVWLSVTALRVNDSIVGYVGIAQDISERKALEAMKNEFISIVSHELRTPITSIQGVLSLMLGGALCTLNDKAEKMLSVAHKNCERLIRLINDILDIEKIDAGKMEYKLVPLELNKLTEEAIQANRAFAETFSVTLKFIPYQTPLSIIADSDKLLQVFTNLLSNATKFSPRNGTVTVKITYADKKATIAFCDTGSGIPEAFQKTIFQKFSQADSTTTRKQGGTGLGLSITKAIVEKLGGTIRFETQAHGGTTFFVELPASDKQD